MSGEDEENAEMETLAEAIWALVEENDTDVASVALAEVVGFHIVNQPPTQRKSMRDGIIEIIDRMIIVGERGGR